MRDARNNPERYPLDPNVRAFSNEQLNQIEEIKRDLDNFLKDCEEIEECNHEYEYTNAMYHSAIEQQCIHCGKIINSTRY